MLASVRNSKDGDDVHTVYLLSNDYFDDNRIADLG